MRLTRCGSTSTGIVLVVSNKLWYPIDMAKTIRIIINRQKAAANRKYKGRLPEEPTISIHEGSEIDYAYAVKLGGEWILKQDYANSPCSGAHIWIESTPSSTLDITSRVPLSDNADAVIEHESDTQPEPEEYEEYF